MFITVVILVSFTSVGNLLGRISAAVARSSPWRTWYVPQKKQPHIILAGAPQGYYLKFFAELFSEVSASFFISSQRSALFLLLYFCSRLVSCCLSLCVFLVVYKY